MDEWKRMVDMADKAMREPVQDFAETAQGYDLDPGYQAGLRRAVEIAREQCDKWYGDCRFGGHVSATHAIAAAIEAEIEGS